VKRCPDHPKGERTYIEEHTGHTRCGECNRIIAPWSGKGFQQDKYHRRIPHKNDPTRKG
jgi:hypothetical protein